MTDEEVRKDVEGWIENFLANGQPELGDHPPCPYARSVLRAGKVNIQVCRSGNIGAPLKKVLEKWDPKFQVVILVSHARHGLKEMENTLVGLQPLARKNDLVIFLDHPHEKFMINGLETTNGKFPLFIIQKRSEVMVASSALKGTGYYDNWSEENLNDEGTAHGTR